MFVDILVFIHYRLELMLLLILLKLYAFRSSIVALRQHILDGHIVVIVLCLLQAGRAALLLEVTTGHGMEMIIGLLLLSLLGNLYRVALIETFETAIQLFFSDLIEVTLIARIVAHLNWLLAGQRL